MKYSIILSAVVIVGLLTACERPSSRVQLLHANARPRPMVQWRNGSIGSSGSTRHQVIAPPVPQARPGNGDRQTGAEIAKGKDWRHFGHRSNPGSLESSLPQARARWDSYIHKI
jgi:hypothetical protein